MKKIKLCSKCKKNRLLTSFYPDKTVKSGLRASCIKCELIRTGEWKKLNSESLKLYNKKSYEQNKHKKMDRRLKREYGITLKEREQLFLSQSCACAICKTPEFELPVALAVDHNHLTGQVRGLLCRKCNMALGLIGDTRESAQDMLNYLDKSI